MIVDDFVVEERLSVWQKKRVRTIIVNGRSKKSSRRSIAGALAMAKPYERIELVGVEYFETLSIGIPLEIVAAEGEDPCIVSRGSCVTITQDVDVYFERVHFVSKGKSKYESAVLVMNGRTSFFRCKMNSVLIGGYAKCILDNCTVAESYNGYGVQVSGTGSGEIRNCVVSTHAAACVEIDTKGAISIRDCTIRQPSNGGHGVSVLATHSFADSRTAVESLACRKVTVTKCRIYVSSEIFRPKDREWVVSDTVVGKPSCVVISRDACPVFSYNEIMEGFFGFVFDFAGSAVLEGNCISRQTNSGILVIVDERNYSLDTQQQNLRISGGNLIDRCYIGVDIQCYGKTTNVSREAPQSLISQHLPSGHSSFDWFDELHKTGESNPLDFLDSKLNVPVRVHGRSRDLKELREDLGTLATLVSSGYPEHFGEVDAQEMRQTSGETDMLVELLRETLKLQWPLVKSFELSSRLLKIRGNKGVDIVQTRFSACELCAIRFENNSYGLVEDCDFVNCGATAIVVSCGAHPLIVGCTFEQSKGAGIFVNSFANPFIMGNTILNSKEHGLTFRNMSRGIVLGNILLGNGVSGICVTGGSSTLIVSNIIQQGQKTGVTVSGGSKPVILMNKFSVNAFAQVQVSEYSVPFIASNKISSGSGSGIRFESCSGGTVIDNTITYNSYGITVELDADPYVVSNTVLNSMRHGILIENNGLGTFISNEIASSGNCNVFVLEGGFPVFRDNIIRQGSSGGIVVLAEGSGIMEHNFITDNSMGNVIVLDLHTNPHFTGNTIRSSMSGCGVICGREASGRFVRNCIYKNKQCGVYVIGKANPQFVKNIISFEAIGVIISENGCGTFTENDIHSSNSFGIILQLKANPVIFKNNISKSFLSGLLVAPTSGGTVHENNFFENDAGVQLGSTLGTAELEIDVSLFLGSRTPSTGVKGGGILRTRSFKFKKTMEKMAGANSLDPTVVHHNKIYGNTTCGVLLENCSYGVLEENEIENNEMFGVLADVAYSARRVKERMERNSIYNAWKVLRVEEKDGSAVVRKNRICHHKQANIAVVNYDDNATSISFNDVYDSPKGISVSNGATVHLMQGNSIHNCFDGVYADSGGRGCFEDNKIYDCAGTGVYVCNHADPQFKNGNVIERCKVSGVFVDAEGRGLFMDSVIRNCIMGAVVYTCLPVPLVLEEEGGAHLLFATSAPVFKNCIIEWNALHGVLVLTVPSGRLLRATRHETVYASGARDEPKEAAGLKSFPRFVQNKIRNNRHFGVCHELYDFTEFPERHTSTGSDDGTFAQRPFPGNAETKRSSRINNNVPEDHNGYQATAAQQALGTSTILLTNDHHEARMRRQVSFVGNTISNCSIGVVVGTDCYPFFLRNHINNNVFFGMLLRMNSKVMCFDCEIAENGIAGLYSAQGALGSFTSGAILRNNGFCRVDSSPHDPRVFEGLPFMQSISLVTDFSFVGDETLHNVYTSLLKQLEKYANLVADGLYVLCEVVAASSTSLSHASAVCPTVAYESGGVFATASHMDKYDRGWAADGGMGVWLAQGTMTEVRDCLVEGNRNVGVFYARGVQHYHHNLLNFVVDPIRGFPSIPDGEVFFGNTKSARNAGTQYMFFTSSCVFPSQKILGVSLLESSLNRSLTERGRLATRRRSFAEPHLQEMPEAYEDVFFLLRRPAKISENRIAKNGCGVVVHLHHVLKARELTRKGIFTDSLPQPESPSHGKKNSGNPVRKAANRGRRKTVSLSTPRLRVQRTTSILKGKKQMAEAVDIPDKAALSTPDPIKSSWKDHVEAMKTLVNVEKNFIYENCGVGVLCLHIVEVVCGHLGISRLQLEEASNEYNDISVKITLKKALRQPKLLFTLSLQDHVACHAKLSDNKVYKNFLQQFLVTSHYIAVTQGGVRTMLKLDTLHRPSASLFSSQALVKIPLFASLMMIAPPGMFLLEANRISDSNEGIYVTGFVGENSLCLRDNTFLNISGVAIFLEGHLTSATIGKGNNFEGNDVAIRIVMPEEPITVEDVNMQKIMGVTTRIFSNHFCTSRRTSLIVEGSGAPPPIILKNEFSSHMSGSVACLVQGSSVCLCLTKNKFVDSFAPVIITNNAGVSGVDGGVLLEGNHFARNFIGLLVCGGAVPTIVNNIFEEHYRTGIELVGETTRATVRHCIFTSNRRKRGGNSSELLFSYPQHGEVRLNGMDVPVAVIVPDNRSLSDEEVRMPSGVLLDGEGASLIERCYFKGNDIGVDVCSFCQAEIMTRSSCTCLASCFFTENNVAGVLVRAVTEPEGKAGSLSLNFGTSISETGFTIFKECFFVKNVSDVENCGDVVSLDHGLALFSKNLFTGCLHGKKEGGARFENNTFNGRGAECAVYLHKGTRVQLMGNVIRNYKNGVITFPGAWGHLEKNWFLELTHCVVSAPYCNTFFLQNRMLRAKNCAVLAYGGVFTENEISDCTTGVIVRNPIQYEDYDNILAVDKALFDALLSDNRVHSCGEDGILVAGGARIESNCVFSCKNNMNITCPRGAGLGTSVANISKNALFDGEVGLFVAHGSEAIILHNDVFDNSLLGVWVKSGTSGLLQGNSISSALRDGALDMENGSAMKLQQNAIRNQFSPSYNRTLQPHREKERQRAAKALLDDVQELDATLSKLLALCTATETTLLAVLGTLKKSESDVEEVVEPSGATKTETAPVLPEPPLPRVRSSFQEATAAEIFDMPHVMESRPPNNDRSGSISMVKEHEATSKQASQLAALSVERGPEDALVHLSLVEEEEAGNTPVNSEFKVFAD